MICNSNIINKQYRSESGSEIEAKAVSESEENKSDPQHRK
jgi:hypothetical protein